MYFLQNWPLRDGENVPECDCHEGNIDYTNDLRIKQFEGNIEDDGIPFQDCDQDYFDSLDIRESSFVDVS